MFRQLLPESRLSAPAFINRAEIRPGDKPATDRCGHLEYFYMSFAGKSPNFVIAGIPAIAGKHPGLQLADAGCQPA